MWSVVPAARVLTSKGVNQAADGREMQLLSGEII